MLKQLAALIGALGFAYTAQAQIDGVEYDWKLGRDKDGIKVYTSKVAGSKFKAVRAEMILDGGMHRPIGLVFDSAACPEWADLCREERVVETVSATESYVYTYNDIPWPVADRDVLARVVWQHDPQAKRVTMTSTAVTGRLPETKAVRIENALAQWHFTELEDGRVLVENFAHIDPNGPTPAWVTNLLLIDSPFKTLQNMRRMVGSGRYDDFRPWYAGI